MATSMAITSRVSSRIVLSAATIFGFVYFFAAKYKNIFGLKKFLQKKMNPLPNQQVIVCSTIEQCDWAIIELKRRCANYKALGFDCEWVTVKKKRKPIALLQLSAIDGFTVIFRLCKINTIPTGLKDILEDCTIYKVGVAPIDDAKYLFHDYGILMHFTLDLRQIVHLCGEKSGGLAFLAYQYLGLNMDKSWQIRCSNWEEESLSEKQIKYAADDSHIAIELFDNLIKRKMRQSLPLFSRCFGKFTWDEIDWLCKYHADIQYRPKNKSKEAIVTEKNSVLEKSANRVERVIKKRYPFATLTRPLYDNCFLEAPDGTLLCTCDKKKAQWYLDRGIASVIKEDPLTVRLKFEPSGRGVGTTGSYYRQSKENKCVVCGLDNTFIRKNVVPKEYRKYFPEIMKDHSSHDVVLLCAGCHQINNMADLKLRQRLSEQCNAPMCDRDNTKTLVDYELKKVKSAGKALMHQYNQIPEQRRTELEDILKMYFDVDVLTDAQLKEAVDLTACKMNESYESHGRLVVNHFMKIRGGLFDLEELWRQHFVQTMSPKHLPKLWSVTHNRQRLEIEAKAGRLDPSQIELLGLSNITE